MSENERTITREETALIHRIAEEVFTTSFSNMNHKPMTKEDLRHHGIIGLLDAKQRYDQSKGASWLTFAAYRIRGEMISQVRVQPIIRLPQAQQKKVKELKDAQQGLVQKGIETSAENLADELGWPIEKIYAVAALPVSMQEATTTDDRGDENENPGVIISDNSCNSEMKMLRQELAKQVHNCLKGLRKSEDRLILLARLVEEKTLQQIADILNCSNEKIRLRQKSAEEWMKKCLQQCGHNDKAWLKIVK